jgi:hypothetical protein
MNRKDCKADIWKAVSNLAEQRLYVGQKIENLKLLKQTDRREGGYRVWECRCDCGNVVYVSSAKLKRRTVTNCGCRPRPGKHNQNLTGKKVGMLTVDYLTDQTDREGKKLWHLTCACGGEAFMNTGDVNRGKKLHCGCQTTHNRVDLRGTRKGRLTVLYPTDKRTKQGSVIWMCACDCGNKAEVSESALVHGTHVSCGCKKQEAQKMIVHQKHCIDGTCIERLGQKPARRDNKSGVCGVSEKPNQKYEAMIGLKGKKYHLGTYSTIEEATQVRLRAVEEMHMPIIRSYLEEKKQEQIKNAEVKS